jgi:hypothetical protein
MVLWRAKICAWSDDGWSAYQMVFLILSYLDLDQQLDANTTRLVF